MLKKIKKFLKKFPPYRHHRNKRREKAEREEQEKSKLEPFKYATERFLNFSMTSKIGEIATIIAKYHVVEKGLTVPGSRLGFGREMVLDLVAQLESFSKKYGNDDLQFLTAVAVVAEYKKISR